MKKAIITGVTGTIGMALLQELTDQGIEVLAICREGSGRNAQIPHDPKIKCIECSMDRLENITAEEAFYKFKDKYKIRPVRCLLPSGMDGYDGEEPQ